METPRNSTRNILPDIYLTAACPLASFRLAMIMRAPLFAKLIAVASPMPLLPPKKHSTTFKVHLLFE